MSPGRALPAPVSSWLRYEQTVNDKVWNETVFLPINSSCGVRPELRPEAARVWPLEAVFVPAEHVRSYGFASRELAARLGIVAPRGRHAILVHPQSHAIYRSAIERWGIERTPALVTPTASPRSLLAWGERSAHGPVVAKVSLGAVIARRIRTIKEEDLCRGLLVQSIFDRIPRDVVSALRLEWFPEIAGAVYVDPRTDRRRRHHYAHIVRTLPPSLGRRDGSTLIPLFSLVSSDGGREPHLVRLVRRARAQARPTEWFIERVLEPYVKVFAHLVLEEGLNVEPHVQNVLFGIDARGDLDGRIVLRDMCDTTVNIALRIANGKPLPEFPPGFWPEGPGTRVDKALDNHVSRDRRRPVNRTGICVERYGLIGMLWVVGRSLRPWLPDLDGARLRRAYMEMWQRAAILSLHARPLFSKRCTRIAMDEAIAWRLANLPWAETPPRRRSTLPREARALMIGGRCPRRAGAAYGTVATPWGRLFLDGPTPAWFAPAF